MKIFGKTLIICALSLFIYSCSNEEEVIDNPVDTSIKTNADGKITYESVNPIFIASCGGSSCHTSREKPLLISNYAIAKANGASIVSEVVSKRMPENGSLTSAQINAIKQWQTDGFLEK